MDEDEGARLAVRVDSRSFATEVAAMRSALEGTLGDAADVAGRRIEGALLRAVRTGKFGFEDLKRVALSVMSEIARGALQSGFASLGGGSGGLLGVATGLLGGLFGAPGRATGGPVAPGAAYVVGERGPELFVPTSSGRIEAGVRGARDIRITVNVGGSGAGDPVRMAASGRQIAQAVRRAIEAAD